MKLRLITLLLLASIGASGQYGTYNPYGVQRQVSGADTTYRLVGSAIGQYAYMKSLSWYRNNFAPISGSLNYIQASPSSPQNANININGTFNAGDVSYRRVLGRVELSGYMDGSKSALSIFGGAGYSPSIPMVSIYGEDNLGGSYDLLNVRNYTGTVFGVGNNGDIKIGFTPQTGTSSDALLVRDGATGTVKSLVQSTFRALGTTLQDVTTAGNITNRFVKITGQNGIVNGDGWEIFHQPGAESVMQSYDRGGANVFNPVIFNASSFNFGIGNVGIGTNPTAKLDVNGAGRFSSNDGSDNGAVRNQDVRVRTLTANGTGAATTISIPHGYTGITSASAVVASANSSAAAGYNYVDIDGTNVNFYYTVAPVTGTNNLKYSVTIKK